MTSRAYVDPYVYPETRSLINRGGFRTQDQLDRFERRNVLAGRIALAENPTTGDFDLNHLKAIHHRLFGEVYDWAGQIRTVNINKDSSSFQPVSRIESASAYVFGLLHAETSLLDPGVDEQTFIREASTLVADLNYMHPFREGNGRTQRAFIVHVALTSGRELAWRKVSPADHLAASIESMNSGNGDPFHQIFAKMVFRDRREARA